MGARRLAKDRPFRSSRRADSDYWMAQDRMPRLAVEKGSFICFGWQRQGDLQSPSEKHTSVQCAPSQRLLWQSVFTAHAAPSGAAPGDGVQAATMSPFWFVPG